MPLGVSFDFKIFVTLPVHSLCFLLAFEAVAPTLPDACCHASPPPVSYHSSRKETNPACCCGKHSSEPLFAGPDVERHVL